MSMPTPSWATVWEKFLQQERSPLNFEGLLLIDLTSDCPGFQFRGWFAFVVVRAILLRANPAHPEGAMAAVAASEEKVATSTVYFQVVIWILAVVAIAVCSDPESHVISGEMKAIVNKLSKRMGFGLRN